MNGPEIYTISCWVDAVKCGAFIDDDGYGRFISDTHEGDEVYPSDVLNPVIRFRPPKWATHVQWFNR